MKNRNDLIYPELSYKIVGLVYDVHNNIGGGLREKAYESAMEVALSSAGLDYKKQTQLPIMYKGEKVAVRYLDLLIEDKIILELKAGERFTATYIKQVSEYLKHTGYKLGLLINFGKERVTIKRVVNEN
jgi:GxxExxY protein